MNNRLGTLVVWILLISFNVGAVDDLNTSNNVHNVTVDVLSAIPLNITFTRYTHGPLGGITNSWDNYESTVRSQLDVLQSTFPVGDNQIAVTVDTGSPVRKFSLNLDFNCSAYEFKDLLKSYDLAQSYNYTFDKIVGVIPNDAFELPTSQGCVSGDRSLRRAILIKDQAESFTFAHEMAHTYDVCHDANNSQWTSSQDIFNGCSNRNVNNTYNPNQCDGKLCTIENSISLDILRLFWNASLTDGFSSTDNPALTSYMFGKVDGGVSSYGNFWIDNETYIPLATIFSMNRAPIITGLEVITGQCHD